MCGEIRPALAARWATAICALLVSASATAATPAPRLFPQEVADIGVLSDGDLYLFMTDRSAELNDCIGGMTQDLAPAQVLASLQAAGRYPELVRAASEVLGSSHPAVQDARANPRDDVVGIQALVIALAQFGIRQDSEAMRDRLLRAKALSTTLVEMANVSDGRCEPPQGLVEAMARIAPES